jgi:hypothetical protein
MSQGARAISLSSNGLQRLGGDLYEKDFRFIVGKMDYFCPSFIAEFLSPRVSHLRQSDRTIQELQIETGDPNGYFPRFLSLGFGFGMDVQINSAEETFLCSICAELWNTEVPDLVFTKSDLEFDRRYYVSRLNLMSQQREASEPVLDFTMIASHFYEFSASDCQYFESWILERILSDSHLVIENEDSLFAIISNHLSRDSSGSSFSLLEFVRFEYLSGVSMKSAFELLCESFEHFNISILTCLGRRLCLPVTPPKLDSRFSVCSLDSRIISDFPSSFESFRGKEFRLLYRGSRDGFGCRDFHRLCDNRAGTVTVIQSDGGFVFGGYTPVAWRSSGSWINDNSMKSFLFTMKNPHGLSPRVFGLKANGLNGAVQCSSTWGPVFGACEIYVRDQCNSANQNSTSLGKRYINDTGLTGDAIFTGRSSFTVQEIEVFELTD